MNAKCSNNEMNNAALIIFSISLLDIFIKKIFLNDAGLEDNLDLFLICLRTIIYTIFTTQKVNEYFCKVI